MKLKNVLALICAMTMLAGSIPAYAAQQTDVVKMTDGWYYTEDGKVVDTDTVAKNANGWWVIRDGKVDFSYTGFAENANGWWFCRGGQVQFGTNDVIKGTVNGESGWWHVVNGKVTFDTTVAKNSNGWWYIKNGKVDFTANTVAKNTNGWWVIQNGKVNFGYNGLASNENGTWKITNGKVTFADNGVIKVGSNWYNVSGSKVIPGPTVAKNANGWWYIDESGKVDFTFNGVASNSYGTWKITNGKVTFNDNGIIKAGSDWYNVSGSKVIPGPTVAKNANGWWYIDSSGKVDFTYNGLASNENGLWNIKNGKVDFEASELLADGMYGFWESEGTTDAAYALDALNNCTYNKYNDRGSATDASSFENIFQALDFIDECNELRAKHGLSALKVTDLMMAYAISDANYASQNIGHPMQFGVGENLAWGYKDPFTGWYYKEKENYENGFGETGHYLNIVTEGYTLTGFAINNKPECLYTVAHSQVFMYDSSELGTAYTVSEYRERLLSYCNDLAGVD